MARAKAKGALTFEWVVPPSVIQAAITVYGKKVITAVHAIANQIATEAQNDMRRNARWRDLTGNARAALFSMADTAAKDVVMIYLSHGSAIWYGIFLETAHGMAYAVIVPTIQRIAPKLAEMLKTIFK